MLFAAYKKPRHKGISVTVEFNQNKFSQKEVIKKQKTS